MLAAIKDFKAFELIHVLAWQSSVSFHPSPNHPIREIIHDLPLFLLLFFSLLCFINHEDVEVVFYGSSIKLVFSRAEKLLVGMAPQVGL